MYAYCAAWRGAVTDLRAFAVIALRLEKDGGHRLSLLESVARPILRLSRTMSSDLKQEMAPDYASRREARVRTAGGVSQFLPFRFRHSLCRILRVGCISHEKSSHPR